jgi:imidazolonepropionase-like amidohydrolase
MIHTYALTRAELVDGRGGAPIPETSLLISDGIIQAIGPEAVVPEAIPRIDVGGATVMPGLVDAHIHLATWGQNLLANSDRTIPYLVARTVANFRTVMEHGCTAARDCAGLDAGLRDAVADGLVPGPRLKTSVTIVSPTDGLIDPVTRQGLISPTLASIPRPDCDGPEAVRAKVREVLRAGADFIKIATSGGVSSPRVHMERRLFTPAEVQAAVEEAHAAGVPVACHAIGGPGLSVAIQAGVDSIEHGAMLTQADVEVMAERGIWYVPTLAVYHWHRTLGDASRRDRAERIREAHLASVSMARKAGVRIAMGSDAGGYGLDFSLELELLVEAGLTAGEAIAAGTMGSAECAGFADTCGSLEVGKAADLLVVDGRPTSDVRVLRDPERLLMVAAAGNPVAGRARDGWARDVASSR